MESKYNLVLFAVTLFLFASCSITKSLNKKENTDDEPAPFTSTGPEIPEKTRHFRLINTKLEIEPIWANEQVKGVATLTITPWCYQQSEIKLDAKGFIINDAKVYIKNNELKSYWKYNDKILKIFTENKIGLTDTILVVVDYIARPSLLPKGAGTAITNDIGFYFINPDGNQMGKPRQFWTQGEPEASSCWFPTFDQPNLRCTQDVYITVDDSLVTLSNGVLVKSEKKPNGKRTDHWKQEKPHAPYLFMVAGGDFAVINDKWRDKQLMYYVEKPFAHQAKSTFGRTPQMLEFFSRTFGVPFPWDKYAQIVVRDFVSGAMENTGAVVFMEHLNTNPNENPDNYWDYIIAHEMSHHWFGNLVTCEDWSQLPLNEAFATYSEYLWLDYFKGHDEAIEHLYQELDDYLAESKSKIEPLIRFRYQVPDDMFDNHSYAKGALVLNYMRHLAGDSTFFRVLKHYLNTNRNKSVEIHNLRLAFEEITGYDWKYVFDRWFLSKGHPELNIQYNLDNPKQVKVGVVQIQDSVLHGKFKFNLPIAFYSADSVFIRNIWVENVANVEQFDFNSPIVAIEPNPELFVPCDIRIKQSPEQIKHLVLNGTSGADIARLIEKKGELITLSDDEYKKMLKHKYYGVRRNALAHLGAKTENRTLFYSDLIKMFKTEPHHTVREAIVKLLDYSNPQCKPVLINATTDSSYAVVQAAVEVIAQSDSAMATKIIHSYLKVNSPTIASMVSDYLAELRDTAFYHWYKSTITTLPPQLTSGVVQNFGIYLSNNPVLLPQGYTAIFTHLDKLKDGYMRFTTYMALLIASEGNKQYFEKTKNLIENEPDLMLRNFLLSRIQ